MEEPVRCIMFFGDGMMLKQGLEECRQKAQAGVNFRGYMVRWANSIRAEEVWDAKEGICFLLIFVINGVSKPDKPKDDVLRTMILQISDEELMIWLRQSGASGLETLHQEQSVSGYHKCAGA